MDRQAGFLIILLFSADFLTLEAASPPTDQTTEVPAVRIITDGKFFLLTSKENLTLACNTTSSAPVHWKFGETNVNNDGKHYELLENGKRLVLSNPIDSMLGNYTCRHENSATDFLSLHQVIGVPPVRLLGNPFVVEGEKLHLVCSTPANLGPKITWLFGKDTYSTSKNSVQLTRDEENGVENAVLTVENISMSDGGRICCRVNFHNVVNGTEVEEFTEIVVKDRNAALWPFLGICIQLVILYVIIHTYERTGKETEIYESETDQSPDTIPASETDSELRHRSSIILDQKF